MQVLEDVIYGKSKIDSLISLFGHEGYEKITEDEMIYLRSRISLEEIERELPQKRN